MPSFLTSILPQISHALLALDISNNFLGALPPVLAICEHLEELNIASNPLRVLPVFLADLVNLRVLIADSTGINTLPESLSHLEKLHTISIRKNKLNALPSWLCLLPALQTLYVDGNAFQGPWKALVEPLLAKVPMTPVYPPSTPVFPIPSSVSAASSSFDTEPDTTDTEDLSDTGSPNPGASTQFLSPEEEDHTLTPDRLPPTLGRSVTAPHVVGAERPPPRPLTRTRTTPNRAHYDQSRGAKSTPATPPNHPGAPRIEELQKSTDRPELRKMKSAGELRRGKSAQEVPPRPPMAHYPTSLSSTNLLRMGENGQLSGGKQYGSLGPSASARANVQVNGMRPQLTQSLWNNAPNGITGPQSTQSNRSSAHEDAVSQFPAPMQMASDSHQEKEEKHHTRSRSAKDGKDKGGRWGFLKKMSMGKMRVDPSQPVPPVSTPARPRKPARPHTAGGSQAPAPSSALATPASLSPERVDKLPQIDVRFSTTGILESFSPALSAAGSAASRLETLTIPENANVPPVLTSPNLLSPPTTLPRTAKRRSFLPIDNPGSLSLSIPPSDTSSRLVAVDDKEDFEAPRTATPLASPDIDQLLRKEEERARETYSRALRSVMAYLKDMNDLGLSQQPNPMSVYGSAADDILTNRSRRPTMVDGQRDTTVSMSASSSTSESGQLRSVDSMVGLRSGTSAQTLSVATTDSSGSSSTEERKWKDDKSKRAMIIKEIVATERTYVKGLQELEDIYIKPAGLPVNILSGVGTGKETVVPASERKVVFGGIEALFSFHKDSFLPALEVAAAPLMKSSSDVQQADADGQMSINVVKAVGNMFLKHVAFLKMYSTYINNFDSSVQRVKYWTSDKSTPNPPSPAISTTSPSSSTAQLVSLGLSLSAVSSPNLSPDPSNPSGLPPLSSSQRKRIKTYLKRCRLNPRHSQLNLEGYLLLPVQRIPRYRLLLEELMRSTPPPSEYQDDPLDRALAEISSLANNMNEGKRESESRRKLVQWQARIRGRFPSPLVQPHRRLIMDGPLLLTRVVRKAMVSFEAINGQGDSSTVQVDCLAPELTPRSLMGVLCNDLLVLCRDPSEGQDTNSAVDLWAVLRMQTLPQPASIVHGNVLRLVDNKAILYFDAPSPSDALNWYRAINLHIPASKS